MIQEFLINLIKEKYEKIFNIIIDRQSDSAYLFLRLNMTQAAQVVICLKSTELHLASRHTNPSITIPYANDALLLKLTTEIARIMTCSRNS